MEMMKLTTERLFQTGEFKPVDEGYIRRKDGITFFPTRMRFSRASLTAVACVFESKRGIDFSINANLKEWFAKVQMEDRIKQAYIAMCYGEGKINLNPQLITYRTWAQQEKKLNGYHPVDGKHGPYFWVDQDGNVTTSFEETSSEEWVEEKVRI